MADVTRPLNVVQDLLDLAEVVDDKTPDGHLSVELARERFDAAVLGGSGGEG